MVKETSRATLSTLPDNDVIIDNLNNTLEGAEQKENLLNGKMNGPLSCQKKIPNSPEKNKITSYFSPARHGSIKIEQDSPEWNGGNCQEFLQNIKAEVKNGLSSYPEKASICTRSRSLQLRNAQQPMTNGGVSFNGYDLRQTTPSPVKKDNLTPASSPRSGPATPHKIQALNEEKLQLEVPLSQTTAFSKLKLSSPKDLKFGKKCAKTKKNKLPIGASNQPIIQKLTLEKSTKLSASVNGAVKPNQRTSQITEFFPIRRSHRKPKTTILQEKQKEIEERILYTKEEGLKMHDFGDKGRGVVTTRNFKKGDMVIEYIGDLIDTKQARDRELKYAKDSSKGCYMYYFTHQNTQYCIDATEESCYLGRLVNHSRTSSNLTTKTVDVNGQPHLILIAKKDLDSGTEVLYDYGDRSKQALQHHPWLAL